MLSIKFKEMKHKAACKQIVCPSTQPRPLACSQTANFAESGHDAYGNEGNETHVRYEFEYVCFNIIEGIEYMNIMHPNVLTLHTTLSLKLRIKVKY